MEEKKHSGLAKQVIGWILRGIAFLLFVLLALPLFVTIMYSDSGDRSIGFLMLISLLPFFLILSLMIFMKISFRVIKVWVIFVLLLIWGWLSGLVIDNAGGSITKAEDAAVLLSVPVFIIAYIVIVILLKKAGVKKLFDGESADQKEGFPAKLTFIIILFLLFFVGPVLALFFYMPNHGGYNLGTMDEKCKELASDLRIYYQDCNENSVPVEVNEFIDFVVDEENLHINKFSKEEPFGEYISEGDFGVCLYFPEKPASDTEVLIGHTTLIADSTGAYGVVFTLNGGEIKAEMFEKKAVVNLVGEERLEEKKPNIYYWGDMDKYLVDKEMEKEINAPVRESEDVAIEQEIE